MVKEQYNALNKENSTTNIDKYLETDTLKRLNGIGLFCGLDYVSLAKLKPIEYYSRFDHSRNIAYTAYKLTGDLTTALAGLFHDVGTLAFSHVNSFRHNEALNQDHDEKEIKSVLLRDKKLLEYLKEDHIKLEDVINPKQYPVIDKDIPALCLDRIDSILATNLIWQHRIPFLRTRELYFMLCYTDSLKGLNHDFNSERFTNFQGEIFLDEAYTETEYEDFLEAIRVYSKILLTKEDRYMMEVLGLALNYYLDQKVITEEDLFNLSEQEIINKFLDSKFKDVWLDISTFDKVWHEEDPILPIISKPKIRQANPLCLYQGEIGEFYNISGEFYHEIVNLEVDLYLTRKYITGNLSNQTKKVLSRYKK